MTADATAIRAVIQSRARLTPDHVTDTTPIDQLGLDSFATAEAMLAVEDRCGRPLDMEQLHGKISPRTTFGELVALLEHALMPC